MAKTKDSVVVELRAENQKLKADLNKAKGTVKGFGSSTTAAFKKIGIAAAAAFGTAKIISFVKTGITEFAKFDRSMTQITNKIERAGQGFDGMADQVENYIRSAEEASRFSKFELAASLDDLLLKTGDYNTALQLNEKAMDLAVAGNISLQTASQALSLAYEGNTSGVSQIARVMGMATEDAKDLNKVFAELEKSTKGVARSEVGMATELDKLNNSLNDGAELIGEEVGPMLVKFARFLVGMFTESVRFVIKLFKTWWVWLKTIGEFINLTMGPLLDWLGEKARQVATLIVRAWGWMTGQFKKSAKIISDMAGKSNSKVVKVFKDGAAEIKAIWETSAAEKVAIDLDALANTFALREEDNENKKDKEQEALASTEETRWADIKNKQETDAAMTLSSEESVTQRMQANENLKNFIIGSNEAQLISFGLTFETIKGLAEDMATGISAAIETFVIEARSGATTVEDAFKAMARSMFRAIVKSIGESLIKQGAAKIAQGIAAALGIVTAVAAPGLFAGGAKLIAAGAVIKGASIALAEGGIVTEPRMALIGEAGPEAVIPLDKAGFGAIDLSGSTFNLSFPDVRDLADVESERFAQSAARQLATGLQDVHKRMGRR